MAASKQWQRYAGQGLAGLLVLVAVLFQPLPARAAQVAIAAIVGEDVITTTDVSERRDLVMATAGIPPTVENQQKIMPRIVQSLIDEALQLQEAKNQSVSVTDEELNKAIASLPARGEQKESIRDFITRNNLSPRSFEAQLRAQLAWNKVVQRALRRNISIAQDEVLRAQKSAASAPGATELRLQAVEVGVEGSGGAEEMQRLMEEIALQIKSGGELSNIAMRYIKNPRVHYNPPVWVEESSLPPPLQQVLRGLKTGETTPPVRSERSMQIIQLLDRSARAKLSDATEYAIKQITITVPMRRDKASIEKLQAAARLLRAQPGNCTEAAIPEVDFATDVQFLRMRLGALSPQQRSIIGRLEVGDVSEPLLSPEAVRLVMLCEKMEPAEGNLPDAEAVRQQLFAEKLELEAQKHLRNLRREAFIDIKGNPGAR